MKHEDIPAVADLVARMDEHVAGLDDFKRRLALLVHRHLVAGVTGAPQPPNLLVVGPSGGGKTHTIRSLLSTLSVPWVQGTSTNYTDTGYDGLHLPHLYGQLFENRPVSDSGKPVAAGEYVGEVERFGIVILDEFDKLRVEADADARSRARNTGLQAELLTLVEGTSVTTRNQSIRTHGILHIAVGAFQGLNEIVVAGDPSLHLETPGLHEHASLRDLVRYGFMEELIGRFSSFVTLPPLTPEQMQRILDEHVLPSYVEQCAAMGVTLTVTDSARFLMGSMASKEPVGARALAPLLEDCLTRSWAAARPGDELFLDHDGVEHEHAMLRQPVAA